ncbi:MAG: type I restriction endonuclease subunit S [Deltaproteobacteria bacterium HGW-Deltaproteobacteria-3]|nr:MAG: type I restriction endonuclease subunit S [Deltaproteobacteria bacterium HGW-Deltaproteobacteria-3]
MHLIADHLDIWTAAPVTKANGGRGRVSAANRSPYGIKKLRELILELAVRGMLVDQDPNDEPASVLLEKIEKEKNRLIKEGKIKKQKPLPKISEEENPFELPPGWKWARLGEVSDFVNGFAFKSSDFVETGIGIVKIGDIQNGELTNGSMSRVKEDVVAGLDDFFKVIKGDLLIAMSGATTGKLGFNRTDEIFYINQRVGKISPYCLDVEYLFYPLTTKIVENLAKSMGSAIPNLSTVQIKNIVFALPPLAEQHRIVAKVDGLMALCDRLEQQQGDSSATHQTLVENLLATLTTAADHQEFAEAWHRIAGHFDTLFTTEESIDQLKQSILQLAVQGKLVPQDPNDEPASVLLEKIAKEKARLIKEGKIKKQKPLPEISDAEKLFEVPEGWVWARLNDVYDVRDGTHDTPRYVPQGYPLVTSKNLSSGKLDLTEIKFISEKDHLQIKERSGVDKFDILFAMIGSIGNPVIVDIEDDFSIKNVAIFKYYVKQFSVPEYLCKFLSIASNNMKAEAAGGVQSFVSLGMLRKYPAPIPPLAEQHRIVAKIDELMALCDQLKATLTQSQQQSEKLIDAMFQQLLVA